MSVTTVRVTGAYRSASGPIRGSVTFTPTSLGVDAQDNVILTQTPATVDLDADGTLSVDLVASDTAGMQPSPILYEVTELLAGVGIRTYRALIPASASDVSLADIAPVPDGSSQPVIVYVQAAPQDSQIVAAETAAREAADAAETARALLAEAAAMTADDVPTQPSRRTLGFGPFEAAPGDELLSALLRLQSVESLLGLFVVDGGDPAESEAVVATDDGGEPDSIVDSVVDGGLPDLASSVERRLEDVESLIGQFAIDGGSSSEAEASSTDDGGGPDSIVDLIIDGGIPEFVSSVDGGTP